MGLVGGRAVVRGVPRTNRAECLTRGGEGGVVDAGDAGTYRRPVGYTTGRQQCAVRCGAGMRCGHAVLNVVVC